MRNVVKTPPARKLAPKGKARLSLFSWEASTANLIAACERVAAKPFVCLTTPSWSHAKPGTTTSGSEADRAARLESSTA